VALKSGSKRNRASSQPARVSKASPAGILTGVIGGETQALLSESGALAVMRTPNGLLRPLGLMCETVNLCNSDCVFCPYSLQTRSFGTMAPELFVEVCRQYDAMGGGPMSLTPVVGDVLLDKELPSRLEALRQYRHAIHASITTNLYGLDRHSDEVVSQMLETFVRLHVSVYGLTAEENAAITQRSHFNKFAVQARRFARLWERSSQHCSIWVSFRNLHQHSTEELRSYVGEHFGHEEWFVGSETRYANWGGRMSGTLPGDARWLPASENRKPCMLLTTALQVYWDGRVSACSCCDYDAGKDLALGSVCEQTLTEIYNSAANRQIWANQEAGKMQNICHHCTFYIPLTRILEQPPIGQGWFDFNGG